MPPRLYAGALAAAYRGRVQEARTLAEEGLDLSHGRGVFMIQNACALGFLELSLGDAAAAARRLRSLPPLLEQMGYGEPSHDGVLPNAIDALVQLGELDDARPLVDRLEDQGRRLDNPYGLSTGARSRGLLLAAEGDVVGAERAFAEALAHHERMPCAFERGRTLLALGSVRRRAKRKRDARDALQEAAEIFDSLGAPLWTALARKELARIGGRALSAGDELTETERMIADLVARGPVEQGGRSRALAEPQDRRVEPLEGVREARRPLPLRAGRASALTQSRGVPRLIAPPRPPSFGRWSSARTSATTRSCLHSWSSATSPG